MIALFPVVEAVLVSGAVGLSARRVWRRYGPRPAVRAGGGIKGGDAGGCGGCGAQGDCSATPARGPVPAAEREPASLARDSAGGR